MKKCFKCGEIKPLTEFYAHPEMKDGHLNKCKECTKRDVAGNYRTNIDHYKDYEKSRLHDPKRMQARRAHARKMRKENPLTVKKWHDMYDHDQKQASTIVNNALRDHTIEKKPCMVCGNTKSEGHHEDYAKPLEVIWLCRFHHGIVHGAKNYLDRITGALEVGA